MDISVQTWLGAPGALEQRRDVRRTVLWLARIRTEGNLFRCLVRDISHGGARLQLDAPMVSGSMTSGRPIELFIERFGPRWTSLLSHGALGGEIVWRSTPALGIEFTVDPQRAAAIIDAALTS